MASVLIPLAQGCEELEAVTIIDLLRRAGIEVVTAGLDEGMVRAARGTVIVPDTSLDQAINRKFDMVILPGGMPGADNLNKDQRIHDLLHKTVNSDGHVAAICAAPKVLATAGLLNNKQVTAYPGTLEGLQVSGMKLNSSPVVKDGKVITSRGPGTAMDFALELIEVLEGRAKRDEVEAGLER